MFKKYFSKAILVAFMLVLASFLVTAEPFKITKVTVDNDIVSDNSIVNVQRDETVRIKVNIEGIDNTTDNRVKAFITGYRDKIEDISRKFDLDTGEAISKTLELSIPSDIEAKDYGLKIRVYNDNNYIEKSYKLRLKNFITIKDISLSNSVVSAGTSIVASVDLESSNYEKTEYATLQLSISTLRLSSITYINNYELNDNGVITRDLVLKIPKTADQGYYDLKVTLKDSDGNELVEKEIVIKVDNTFNFGNEGKTIINIATPQETFIGEQANIRILITNLNDNAETYSVEIDGEKNFATSKIEPQFLTLNSDRTGQVNVMLDLKENQNPAKKSFILRVKAKDKVIEEFPVNLDIKERSNSIDKSKLVTVFASLFIIGVIIFLVIKAVEKIRRNDERDLESSKGPRYF